MAHPNAIVDAHLVKHCGAAGYTVAGVVATITGTLTPEQLDYLEAGLLQQKFDKVVTAGALKFQPR